VANPGTDRSGGGPAEIECRNQGRDDRAFPTSGGRNPCSRKSVSQSRFPQATSAGPPLLQRSLAAPGLRSPGVVGALLAQRVEDQHAEGEPVANASFRSWTTGPRNWCSRTRRQPAVAVHKLRMPGRVSLPPLLLRRLGSKPMRRPFLWHYRSRNHMASLRRTSAAPIADGNVVSTGPEAPSGEGSCTAD